MIANNKTIIKVFHVLIVLVCMHGCTQDSEDAMTGYLKRMTEIAVIIENTHGQEGASQAAAQILTMRDDINNLVSTIRSLPEPQESQLLQQHDDEISRINQRISNALSELALRDAKARRTISDAIIRLDRL